MWYYSLNNQFPYIISQIKVQGIFNFNLIMNSELVARLTLVYTLYTPFLDNKHFLSRGWTSWFFFFFYNKYSCLARKKSNAVTMFDSVKTRVISETTNVSCRNKTFHPHSSTPHHTHPTFLFDYFVCNRLST